MTLRREKPDLLRDAEVVCIGSFRVGSVGQLIEKGRVFHRESAVVREHPEYFSVQVPLIEVIEAERSK
jgi:hypothetical protein